MTTRATFRPVCFTICMNFNLPPKSLQEQNNSLEQIYKNPDFVTLYRYENPTVPYDPRREGDVSKETLIGSWFTSKIDQLKVYIKMRQPGGKVVTIRVPIATLDTYDASKNEETKNMDIEVGNFIVPQEVQADSRIEIPLTVNSSDPKKFPVSEWKHINTFIDSTIVPDKLLERIEAGGR